MKKKNGFTVLEIVIVGAFSGLLLVLFFVQKANIDAMNRDDQRITAINAMYYALEEGFYANNGYYPETISEENLTMMDPALFTDPKGILMGEIGCSYYYSPANCDNGKCQEYTLKAELEKGSDLGSSVYMKSSRN